MGTRNTILLKANGVDPDRREGVASGAITPGHLIETGGSYDVQVHSTAGGNARKMFAIENDLIGDGISDAYAAEKTVQYIVAPRGAEINALLADSQEISEGDPLESAGDGTLQLHTAPGGSDSDLQMDAIVAYAAEDKSNSSGAAVRIVVEVA